MVIHIPFPLRYDLVVQSIGCGHHAETSLGYVLHLGQKRDTAPDKARCEAR